MAKVFSQAARCPIVIGRDAHLAALDRVVEQISGGTGQTLLIAGEAGIGKSRLVAEAKGIAARQDWLIVEGHCFEPDRILPYAPFLDLLRAYLSSLSPAEVAEALGAEVRDLVRILPELARLLGGPAPVAGLDPAQERRLVIQALMTVLLRLSSQRPVLAIIEDLHWSDDTSLDVLLHLARRLAGSPLLLVLTFRDDEVGDELRHVLATIDRERLAVELALQRLDPTEVGAMVSAIVADAQPIRAGFREALHALTDGNPFFIEEVLNALQSADDRSARRAWPDRIALDDLHVPRSVHDAVYRRVERLSPDARLLLQFASVAGRRWDFALLEILTGHQEADLLRLVKELIAAQLLVEDADDRFAFRHALTQKAVYTALLSRERRRLHQTSADAYEQLDPEVRARHLADLAYHCYEAGDWRRALDYATHAGEQAMELYAPQAAVEQFSRALDAAQRLSRSPTPRLYRARGRSHETLGDFERARADYESALTIAKTTGDQRAEWQVLLDLGLLWAGRDYERTAEYCQRALSLARTLGDPVVLAQSLNRVGNWHSNSGRPNEGYALHREALSILEASGDDRAMIETLDLLGMACYVAGNPVDSARYCLEAVELCRMLDDRPGLASCLSILALTGGNHQTDAGTTAPIPLDECARHALSAIDITREIGWKPGEAFAGQIIGGVYAAAGQFDQALVHTHRSLSISAAIEHEQWTVAGLATLGACHVELLDGEGARHILTRALEAARAIGSRLWELAISPSLVSAYLLDHDLDAAQSVLDRVGIGDLTPTGQGARQCLLVLAELCLERGAPEEGLELVDELIATDPGRGRGHESPALLRVRGEALAKRQALNEAEQALRAAVRAADVAGRPAHHWRTLTALGRVLRQQRRLADADAAFAEARAIIDGLAATVPDLSLRETFRVRAVAQLPRPRELTDRQAAARAYGGLTARERDVAVLVAQGLSNRAIAEYLIVSEPTVATHVSHVLAKLGFSSRTQIATWAVESGLLHDI